MGTDIDGEGARGDLDLIDAEQENYIERSIDRHLSRAQAAGSGYEADIERADARCGAVQNAVAIPVVLHNAKIDCSFGGERSHHRSIATRERAGTDDDHRPLGLAHRFRERMPADRGKRLRSGADIVVSVSQVGFRPDDADWKFSGAPALTDARIEDRGFFARIGADDQ